MIVLVNLLFYFTVVLDIFAIINLILFLTLLLSPCCLLIYGILEEYETQNRNRATIAFYIILPVIFAILIGLMIAYLARGDSYLNGLIIIPNEISWVIVTIIAVLLLIPLINLFSSYFIAMWLGSLIYYKIYQTSYIGRALIGSPLFTVPLLIVLASEASRRIQSRRAMVYVFDKINGSLKSHKPPLPDPSYKKLLATTLIFLIWSLLVAAGGGAWNEIQEANVIEISSFRLSLNNIYQNDWIFFLPKITFSLVNARDGTIAQHSNSQTFSI